MSFSTYVSGAAWLLAVAACCGLFGHALGRRLCTGWNRGAALLAALTIALSAALLVSILAGLVGAFTDVGVLVGALLLCAVAVRLLAVDRRRRSPQGPAPGAPSRLASRELWVVLIVMTVLTAVWMVPTLQSFDVGIYRQDSTWYHLTFSADFVQTKSVTGVHFTDPLKLTVWFYPRNSEVFHALGMLAFNSDFLSPLLNLGWLYVALLAAWCLGRPYGAALVAFLAVAVVCASDMMLVQAGNAPSDMPGLAFLLTSAAILANGQGRRLAANSFPRLGPVPRGPLFVAALAAGLAIGTKMTLLLPVALLTIAVFSSAWKDARPLRSIATWLGGTLLTGGYWYLHNLAAAGNPLPWIGLGPLPSPQQLPLYPRPPHRLIDYWDKPSVWVDWLAPSLDRMLGPLWPLLILAMIVGLGLAIVGSRRRPLLLWLAAAGIASAIGYAFIPISAPGPEGAPYGFASNLRYFSPALILGLVLFGIATSRRWRRLSILGFAGALLVTVLASEAWDRKQTETAVTLAVFAGIFGAAYLSCRRQLQLAALTALAVLATIGVGWKQEDTSASQRYSPSLAPPADNPGFRSTPQWQPIQGWANHQRDKRIAIVGPPAAFGQYVFYGPDLSNRVQYVGQRGPHGAYWPVGNCFAWRKALNETKSDYLVVTPAISLGPLAEPQESVWTRGDPAAREILRASPGAIFRIDGELDPSGCRQQPQAPVLPLPWGGGLVPPGGAPPPLPPGAFGR